MFNESYSSIYKLIAHALDGLDVVVTDFFAHFAHVYIHGAGQHKYVVAPWGEAARKANALHSCGPPGTRQTPCDNAQAVEMAIERDGKIHFI